MEVLVLVAFIVGGYLLGSIPFGLLLAKAAGAGDIRTIGSGNIGATNVLRTGQKGLAFLTLLLDAGKGAVPALIAGSYDPKAGLYAAVGAFLGHLFPVWLKFKGGKGVATFFGIWLAVAWPIGLMALLTWLVVAILSRISALASLMTALLTIFYVIGLSAIKNGDGISGIWIDGSALWFALMVCLLILYRHTANIKRLISGTEPKIGKK